MYPVSTVLSSPREPSTAPHGPLERAPFPNIPLLTLPPVRFSPEGSPLLQQPLLSRKIVHTAPAFPDSSQEPSPSREARLQNLFNCDDPLAGLYCRLLLMEDPTNELAQGVGDTLDVDMDPIRHPYDICPLMFLQLNGSIVAMLEEFGQTDLAQACRQRMAIEASATTVLEAIDVVFPQDPVKAKTIFIEACFNPGLQIKDSWRGVRGHLRSILAPYEPSWWTDSSPATARAQAASASAVEGDV